jgi:hypothetical protein
MACVPIFITLLCSGPIFIADVCMCTYIYSKNVPINMVQSLYFYNGFSRSVPIFINSRQFATPCELARVNLVVYSVT